MIVLLRIASVLIMFLSYATAHAAITRPVEYSLDGLRWFPTKQAACNYDFNDRPSDDITRYGIRITSVDPTCDLATNSNPNWVSGSYRTQKAACPANSTQSGDECVCKAGFAELGNQCVPDDGGGQCVAGAEKVDGQCQCKEGYKQELGGCHPEKDNACAGLQDYCSGRQKWSVQFRSPGMNSDFVCQAAVNENSGGGAEPAFPGCSKGCMVSTGTTVSVKDDAGKWYTTGTGKYVGSTCDPNVINKLNEGKDDEKDVTPPDSKDPGKCNGQAGTVNGKDVCLPWSGAEGDNKSETKQNPDGSTTKTDTKTTCTGNSCTTTTTTTGKDSSGNTTGTTTTSTTTTKDDYCAKNSGSSVCGALDPNKKPGTGTGNGSGSGSGSGSCEGKDCEDNAGPSLPGKPSFGKYGAPEMPKLYKQKYPDGPKKLWDAKMTEVKAAPISKLAGELMPKVPDGGVPPVWIVDFNFGSLGNLGVHDISPPAWIWAALRAITILSALLLARRLIFGG